MIRLLALALLLTACAPKGVRHEGTIDTLHIAASAPAVGVLMEPWPIIKGAPQIVFTLKFQCEPLECSDVKAGERAVLHCTDVVLNEGERTGHLSGCVAR